MTSLEELQAAHKRLNELALGHNNGHPWMQLRDHAGIESACADGPHFIADTTGERTADLIVTLHRTIDAQLSILDTAITMEGTRLSAFKFLRVEAIRLARAINGGSDDAA